MPALTFKGTGLQIQLTSQIRPGIQAGRQNWSQFSLHIGKRRPLKNVHNCCCTCSQLLNGGREGAPTTLSLSDPGPACWTRISPPAGHAPGANSPPPTEDGGRVPTFEKEKKKEKKTGSSHLCNPPISSCALKRALHSPCIFSGCLSLP